MAELFFYVLSVGAIGFGAGVVVLRNPLFSVLSLLGSFVCLAGIYLVMGFQFLAAAQLLVYAGAVMVLFLFAVMLLNLGDEAGLAAEQRAGARNPIAVLGTKRVAFIGAAVLGLALVGLIAATADTETAAGAAQAVTTEPLDDLSGLASLLFSRYALVFQAAGVLLLIAMVAVIVLAKRHGTSLRRERAGVEPNVSPNVPPIVPHSELSLGDPQA